MKRPSFLLQPLAKISERLMKVWTLLVETDRFDF